MSKIVVALDWTPNTNHTGFYVAKAKGWYEDKGLQVEFISPHTDSYHRTPASRLRDGTATFAVGPSESVISALCATGSDKPRLQAVAALLQQDLSAIVTLASSGLDRPRQLDGKKYASYGARYEGRIVQQLIRNDGGKGDYIEDTPAMLSIWDTLLKGEADATWVFMGWEGVEAELKGVALNVFRLADYNIPYGYSPVLLADPNTLRERAEEVRAFMQATSRGFIYAAENPEIAADLFYDLATAESASNPLPTPLDRDMVRASQAVLSKAYLGSKGDWGIMDGGQWNSFLDWLAEKGLLTTLEPSRNPVAGVSTTLDALRGGAAGETIPRDSIKASDLFTNEYLV